MLMLFSGMQFMRKIIKYSILSALTAWVLISCDPTAEFEKSMTLTIRVDNKTSEPIYWESNWNYDADGALTSANGIIFPLNAQNIWTEVDIPFLSSKQLVYDFFIDYIKENSENPYFRIYSYDAVNQCKGELLKTWKIDDQSENSFFSINNIDYSAYPEYRPGSHINSIFRYTITEDMLRLE